jgi:HAMP domain-containing protein
MRMATPEARPADAPRRSRGGLQARIFLTFGVIVVGLVTAAVTFFVRSESDSLLRETKKRGFAVARSIAWLSTPALLSYNYIALSQAASRSQAGSEIAYVVIYDKEGQIAADSRSPNSFGQPPRETADFTAQAAREERWTFIESRRPGDARLLEILLPVYVEGYEVKWGTVRVGISLEGLDDEVAALTKNLIVAGFLAAILCLLGARFAAGRITRPIGRLVGATRAIAQGDYSQRLNLKSGDEIETLAWHFDHMADEVQRQQAEILASRENLARMNQTLEAAVEARTHALTESEAKYRILVDSSPQGLLIVQSGKAVFANPTLEPMTGRPASDLVRPDFDPMQLFASSRRTWCARRSTRRRAIGRRSRPRWLTRRAGRSSPRFRSCRSSSRTRRPRCSSCPTSPRSAISKTGSSAARSSARSASWRRGWRTTSTTTSGSSSVARSSSS